MNPSVIADLRTPLAIATLSRKEKEAKKEKIEMITITVIKKMPWTYSSTSPVYAVSMVSSSDSEERCFICEYDRVTLKEKIMPKASFKLKVNDYLPYLRAKNPFQLLTHILDNPRKGKLYRTKG